MGVCDYKGKDSKTDNIYLYGDRHHGGVAEAVACENTGLKSEYYPNVLECQSCDTLGTWSPNIKIILFSQLCSTLTEICGK